MARLKLGMPAARPFKLDAEEKIFIVQRKHVEALTDSAMEKAGITYNGYEVYAGDYVYGFNEAELREFLKLSGYVVYERYGTNSPNVEKVGLQHQDTVLGGFDTDMKEQFKGTAFLEYPFQFGPWNGERSTGFAMIVSRTLGPVLKRKVMLDVPHARHIAYDERSAFQVHVWSASSSFTERRRRPPTRLWDIVVDNSDTAYVPEPGMFMGHLIMDGDYAVAELLPNALYIHHDLVHHGSPRELKIMERICSEAAKILRNKRKFAKLLVEVGKAREEAQLVLFDSIVRRGIAERSRRHSVSLEAARYQVDQTRSAHFAASRVVFDLEQGQPAKDIERNFRAELEKLQAKQVAHVENVDFGGTHENPTLRIFTDEIVAFDRYTGKHHLLGFYEIVFHLRSGAVRFFNKTQSAGSQGPHINAEGGPCLGNINDELSQYIAHFEIEAATSLAIAYLQNPNSSDPDGARVRTYPVVKPGTKELV